MVFSFEIYWNIFGFISMGIEVWIVG